MKPTEAVFPRVEQPDSDVVKTGIDLRTYLAAMAMQGHIAAGHITTPDVTAAYAVGDADALIAELNKPRK